jgi:pantoate--beta-alanine ligase
VLCGPVRPGHFQGVATVVAKLFGQVQPDVAAFGEKDYQQLLVVKRLVEDLAMPVRIVPVATLREADGLAMSSRNRRLSADLRAVAAHLPTTMARAAARILAGGDAHACAKDAAGELSAKGFGPIDYVELRDAATLALAMAPPARLFAAAHLGGVRLIDNIAVG